MKKGQITMFMMIGIILLVFTALTFYLTDVMQARVTVQSVEASSAKGLVEQCLNLVAEDALIVIGKQGGFAQLPQVYFEKMNTSYLFDNGENNVPDISLVEQELSQYTENHIGLCIDNFESLNKKGISVDILAPPKVTATIAKEDVRFVIDYAVEEVQGTRVTRPEFLPATKTPIKLEGMLKLANAIVDSEQKTNLFDLDIPCELEVTHFPLEKTLVTVITDHNALIQDAPYMFVFAHRR